MNPEIVGWIYCADTPINYPVLQAANNEKYLKLQPDGKTSRSGSIFIDFNCQPDFSSDNTLMYGHNRLSGMFACLPSYSRQSFYEKHPVMWLLTPHGDYRVDLISGFAARVNEWVYDINLFTEKFRSDFVQRCLDASDFRTSAEPVPGTRLLTLSTCHYNGTEEARYVVIGMLIPVIKR